MTDQQERAERWVALVIAAGLVLIALAVLGHSDDACPPSAGCEYPEQEYP